MLSAAITNSQGEQAWLVYKEVESVVDKKYKLSSNRCNNYERRAAIQRLGEAILNRYQLDPKTHSVLRTLNLTLQHPKPNTANLLTVKDLLNAKIVEWEPCIESIQAGYDTWTEGRTAAFRPQKSLQECLDREYFEIKVIVDTDFTKASETFNRLKQVVLVESNRLELKGSSQEKILKIQTALYLLEAAILHKYNESAGSATPLFTLTSSQISYVDSIDLYSFNTMLDAKIGEMSLREALNLSRESVLSRVFGLKEALWGKAASLENVEKAL